VDIDRMRYGVSRLPIPKPETDARLPAAMAMMTVTMSKDDISSEALALDARVRAR
jgi:hypothetical protein